MTEKNSGLITLLMLTGAILGGLCGYFLPQYAFAVGFLGQWFLGALKILIIPVLAAGVITGITSFGELRRAGGLMKTLVWYFLGTTVVAIVIASVVGWIFAPGAQAGVFIGTSGGTLSTAWQSLSQALSSLVPGNLFQAAVEGKYIGLVLLTVLLGGTLASIGLHGRTIVTFFRGLSDGLHRVVDLVLYAAPVGIFALVASAVAGSTRMPANWSDVATSYLSASLIALGIYGLVVLPMAMKLFGGRSVFSFFSDLSPAFLTAFGTSSKTAAFPVTMRCLTDRTRMDNRSVTTALPISTVLGFDGTIVLPIVATIIAASACGAPVGLVQMIVIGLLAAIASLGTAGMPLASLLAAPYLFSAVGLTSEQIGFALAALVSVEWIVDRVRAVVNTGSDAVACALVAGASDARGPIARPSRGRRPERFERDSEESGRERFGGRGEGFGDTRRRGGPAGRPQRGRREEVGGRFTPPGAGPGAGPRPRPDLADRSPFQMKAGRTPALGIDADKPAVAPDRPAREIERPVRETERPQRDTERPQRDRDDRREPRRPGSRFGEGRGPRGRHRGGPERVPESAGRLGAEEPTEESESPKMETPRINPEVVARDLSRVSAQLREPQPIEPREPEHIQPVEPDLSNGSEDDVFETGRRYVDDELPEFDSDMSDNQEDAVDGTSGEEAPSEAERPIRDEEPSGADENEPSESREASFGRGRHFRGSAFRKSETPETEAPEAGTPKEPDTDSGTGGFSNEDASFGRMKRKRTR